jgi:hypothetical protein
MPVCRQGPRSWLALASAADNRYTLAEFFAVER